MRLLHIRTVLAPIDLSAVSDAALQSAAALAAAAGANLHVAHVAPGNFEMISRGPGGRRDEVEHAMREAISRARISVPHKLHALNGDAPDAIARLVERTRTDVVVVGRRRAETPLRLERPLGGTAYAVVTRIDVPCLAITDPLDMPLQRVLVAIDGSEGSLGALLVGLAWASALRDPRGSDPELVALNVHARDANPDARAASQRAVAEQVRKVREHAGEWARVDIRGEVTAGDAPAKTIAERARTDGAQLVVIGTRGAVDGQSTLGSVTARLLGLLDAPVLAVPPAVWGASTNG